MLTRVIVKKHSTRIETKVKQITYYHAVINTFAASPPIIVEEVELIDKDKTR